MALNEYVIHDSIDRPIVPALFAGTQICHQLPCADWDYINTHVKITNSATGAGHIIILTFSWWDRVIDPVNPAQDLVFLGSTSFTWSVDGSGGDPNALPVPDWFEYQPVLRMPIHGKFVDISLSRWAGTGGNPSVGLALMGGTGKSNIRPLSATAEDAPIQIPGLITLGPGVARTFFTLTTHCTPLWLQVQHIPGAVGNNLVTIIDRINGNGLADRIATYEYLPGFGTTAGQQLPPFRERLPMDGHVWQITIINFGTVAVNASWLFQCQPYQEMS